MQPSATAESLVADWTTALAHGGAAPSSFLSRRIASPGGEILLVASALDLLVLAMLLRRQLDRPSSALLAELVHAYADVLPGTGRWRPLWSHLLVRGLQVSRREAAAVLPRGQGGDSLAAYIRSKALGLRVGRPTASPDVLTVRWIEAMHDARYVAACRLHAALHGVAPGVASNAEIRRALGQGMRWLEQMRPIAASHALDLELFLLKRALRRAPHA